MVFCALIGESRSVNERRHGEKGALLRRSKEFTGARWLGVALAKDRGARSGALSWTIAQASLRHDGLHTSNRLLHVNERYWRTSGKTSGAPGYAAADGGEIHPPSIGEKGPHPQRFLVRRRRFLRSRTPQTRSRIERFRPSANTVGTCESGVALMPSIRSLCLSGGPIRHQSSEPFCPASAQPFKFSSILK